MEKLRFRVEFWNGHWTTVLATNKSLESATTLVKKLTAQFLELYGEELGRSVREESWPTRPYQVIISTFTAEAGNVRDMYSVVNQEVTSALD